MKIKLEGVDFPVYKVLPGEFFHTKDAHKWCRIPYPLHPKGCHNFNHLDRCPPKCQYVTEVLDLTKPIYLTHSEFNLEEHMNNLKVKHPDWSDRQLRCVLYWQRKSVNQMSQRAEIVANKTRSDFISITPEALGINVYATAKKAGLKLEPIKTLKMCKHVAVVGTKL